MADAQDFWKNLMDDMFATPEEQVGNALDPARGFNPLQKVGGNPRDEAKRAAAKLVGERINAQGRRPAAFAAHDQGPSGAMSFAAHAQAQSDMMAQVNGAISKEMDSRRRMAENERDRQHEYQMASMQAQARQPQYQPQPQAPDAMEGQHADEYRQTRNRHLMGMAGLHGQSIRTDGRGGVKTFHHSYADSPLGRALFG